MTKHAQSVKIPMFKKMVNVLIVKVIIKKLSLVVKVALNAI